MLVIANDTTLPMLYALNGSNSSDTCVTVHIYRRIAAGTRLFSDLLIRYIFALSTSYRGTIDCETLLAELWTRAKHTVCMSPDASNTSDVVDVV